MKGANLIAFNQIEVQEFPKPELQNDEALIKVEYAGICGSDVHVFSGHHATAKPPLIQGHEFSGTLAEIKTTHKTDLKVGDHVVVQPIISCNTCDLCVQGKENLCSNLNILGINTAGCFAEYVKVPLKKVYKVSPNIDLKLAALMEPLAVAVHDVRNAEFMAGQTAFIIGGGPIGLLIAMVARLSGASKIVISEINDSRIKFIEEYGFTVLNSLKVNVQEEALRMTNGEGFDAVFEVSGSRPGQALMTEICKLGGSIIPIGFPKENNPINSNSIITKELRVKGVRVHAQINFAAAVDIMESGVLNDQLYKLITNEFKLSEIQEAMKFSIEDQEHFKVILKI